MVAWNSLISNIKASVQTNMKTQLSSRMIQMQHKWQFLQNIWNIAKLCQKNCREEKERTFRKHQSAIGRPLLIIFFMWNLLWVSIALNKIISFCLFSASPELFVKEFFRFSCSPLERFVSCISDLPSFKVVPQERGDKTDDLSCWFDPKMFHFHGLYDDESQENRLQWDCRWSLSTRSWRKVSLHEVPKMRPVAGEWLGRQSNVFCMSVDGLKLRMWLNFFFFRFFEKSWKNLKEKLLFSTQTVLLFNKLR